MPNDVTKVMKSKDAIKLIRQAKVVTVYSEAFGGAVIVQKKDVLAMCKEYYNHLLAITIHKSGQLHIDKHDF